jgi:hypothetical protein
MADQNSGGTEDNDPPPRSVDPEAVRARRKTMFQGFRRVASFVFADVAGVTLRGGRTKRGGGGRARGSQGGGGQPARVRPLKSKIGLTPAMLWRQTKGKGKGSAGGKTGGGQGGGKQAKYRKRAAYNFNPALLLRDRSSDWFKQRKLHAVLASMGRDRLAEPPPSTRNLSTRPDRASRTNRNRASRLNSQLSIYLDG